MINDLISRIAAIDALTDQNIEKNSDSVYDGEHHRTKRAAIRIIANMPAVDAAPVRHGRWIPHVCEDGSLVGYDCSECGDWVYIGPGLYNYCGNCGTKMDGEDDDVDK